MACFSKEYLTKYNNLLVNVGLESDNAKIKFLHDTFGVKTLEYINTNVKVKNMIAKFTLSQNDEGKIYDSFIQYIFDFDGDTKKQEPPDFDNYWVLKHINICCDPERIYWILQKIAQHNDSASAVNNGRRSYLQLSDLSCTNINNILIDDKQTVVINFMPKLFISCANENKINVANLYTGIGKLTLNEVINFLKAIDIKRKVHIGL